MTAFGIILIILGLLLLVDILVLLLIALRKMHSGDEFCDYDDDFEDDDR